MVGVKKNMPMPSKHLWLATVNWSISIYHVVDGRDGCVL